MQSHDQRVNRRESHSPYFYETGHFKQGTDGCTGFQIENHYARCLDGKQQGVLVKQMTRSQNSSPLLNYAISRLSPDVFSHPVWVRFGWKQESVALNIIDDLLSAAKNLEEHDPGNTCQILLICAVYQNHSGQHHNALRTTQQALALAERTGLSREIIWGIWGVCAIFIQQRNYEQAASHLVDLRMALTQQNEWILADFVGVIKESLLHPVIGNAGEHSTFSDDRSSHGMLTFTFDWLMQWGFSAHISESESEVTINPPKSHTPTLGTLTQSFFSVQRWQGHWHTLMLMFKGELKLEWAENDGHPTKRQFSFWGSILSSLRLYLSGQNIDSQFKNNAPQIRDTDLLPPAKENYLPNATTRGKNQFSTSEKVTGSHRSEQATTVVPIAVHMLGMFSATIGDLTVKLPGSRGLSLFKYLLLHHKQNTPREVLMDIFWPDAEPETARNNLNVAMHNLRKVIFTVTDLPMIIYEGGAYSLAPDLQVWLDLEEFERCVKAGQRLEARDQLTAAVAEYESAISLYQGDFLEQNPYEEWTVLERERLRVAYLDTLDRLGQIYFSQERYAACITVCQLTLTRDRCREDAHCLLMRCYSCQGQYHLASRQYQSCVEALHAELDVEPALETTQVYEHIRRRERV